MITNPAIRKCNFTGSTPVGRSIASRAAAALKPVLLELGGKNFAIVLEGADLDKAARLTLEGAFLNVQPIHNLSLLRYNVSGKFADLG